jgi:hypothetical protein
MTGKLHATVLDASSQIASFAHGAWQRLAGQAQTAEARRYAVKELARRAGVSREFFDSWDIACRGGRTTISLVPGGSKNIHFECQSYDSLDQNLCEPSAVSRAGFLTEPALQAETPHLIVPFSNPSANGPAPLFQRQMDGSYKCRADLLLSVVFTLCRAEEVICTTRDIHERFPAAFGIAARCEFLERPIVDEYGEAFQEVLRALLPSWEPQRRSLQIKLTHDIDSIGIPFQPRATIGHTLKRRSPVSTVRDLLATVLAIEPAELQLVRRLADISVSRGLHSSFYWKASAPTTMDDGYDPNHPKVQSVIRDLKDHGFEMGVHPGYDTFHSRAELRREVGRLQTALDEKRVGGRQHYLRWSPETWMDWESCGLAYDSTVGFADRIGFRAGTSYPYRPWSLAENRELNLVEIPLVVMDCTPVKYMGLSRTEGLERIRLCVERIRRVGGVFTLLWHNVPLMEPAYRGWYEAILDMVRDSKPYEVPATAEALW